MDNDTRRFRIVGKVQGVYFRHSTRLEAERLGLTGYARNLSDGSVEVLANGTAAALAELAQWLERGPKAARVDQLLELDVDDSRLDNAGTFEVI